MLRNIGADGRIIQNGDILKSSGIAEIRHELQDLTVMIDSVLFANGRGYLGSL